MNFSIYKLLIMFHIGGQRTESSSELIYARQYFVTTVKEFGLQAIDLVSIDYKSKLLCDQLEVLFIQFMKLF